jgi:hypothetical protein
MAKVALTVAASAAMIGAGIATGGLADVLFFASIGLSLGSALIPQRRAGQAPLQDLNVSSSANGAPIPWGYGTQRYAGQVIWSPGLTYRTVNASSGKGGGQTARNYVYSASFAVAFGEGPATINRVWGDSKLIYKGGQSFGGFAPWSVTTSYVPEDLVSYNWNPGTGPLTALFQCIVANSGVLPAGNSLYWQVASYIFWDHTVQYEPGNEVAYPGLSTEAPQPGAIYACIKPSLGDHPDSSPAYWQPLNSYYAAPSFYPGNETQMPDPLIQGVQGADKTPAFRGICYGVWEQMPLANFGNRVPNLRAEVAFG